MKNHDLILLLERTLDLHREMGELEELLISIKSTITHLYGEDVFKKSYLDEYRSIINRINRGDRIGKYLPDNIRKQLFDIAKNFDDIMPLFETSRDIHLNLSEEMLEIDEDIKQLSQLMRTSKHPLLGWWLTFIQDQIRLPVSSFTVLLWLPTHEEIAKYMRLDHSAYRKYYEPNMISNNKIISLSKTELYIFNDGSKFMIDDPSSFGLSETISTYFDIKSSELPCLLIFPNIIARPKVIVDLTELTAEEIKNGLIEISLHISRTRKKMIMANPLFWKVNSEFVFHHRILDYLSGAQINEGLMDNDFRSNITEIGTFTKLISLLVKQFNFHSKEITT